MPTSIASLHALGQSLWYDNIQRRMLQDGTLAAMIAAGELRGMTSNPSIFNAAIAKSDDYTTALRPLARTGLNAAQILDQLVLEDIRLAADHFLPLYQASDGADGYVSVEVAPDLAADTAGTLAEAQRLWQAVGRPNTMIKIPATPASLPAVRQALAAGINVNVTLIFSLERYAQVMEAYLAGLEDRLVQGQPLKPVASVASFFVSRLDSKLDAQLEVLIKAGGPTAAAAQALQGRAAVANVRLAYAQFKETFDGERFARLQAHGARYQRPLWASTSTKNPAYPDTLYVDELIGPHTVNTVPPQTLDAFRNHGTAALTLEKDLPAARQTFTRLAELGIDLPQAMQALETEGVLAFQQAWQALLAAVEARRQAALEK